MRTVLILGVIALAAVVGPRMFSQADAVPQSSSTPSCCQAKADLAKAKVSDCCATGEVCCDLNLSCCSERSSNCCATGEICCELNLSCCGDRTSAKAQTTTAKASNCCAAGELCCELGLSCCGERQVK